MKKLVLSLLITSGLAAAYTGGSWTTGKKIEAQMASIKFENPCYENVKITSTSYKRGLFTSTQDITVEYNDPQLGRFSPTGEGLQLKFKNKIVHGPIPGVIGIGAARIDSELVLDEKMKAELKEWFGDKQALQIRTIVSYGQGGSVSMSSPAVKFKAKDGTDIDWKGFQSNMSFDGKLAHYKADAKFNGLEVSNANKTGALSVSAITFDTDRTQASPQSCIYTGTANAKVDSIKFSDKEKAAEFALEKLESSSTVTEKTELLNADSKLKIAKVRFNQGEVSNVQFVAGVNQLHRPTIDAFIKMIQQAGQAESTDPIAQKAKMEEMMATMLAKKPEVTLERLSFASKSGEAKLSGNVKLSEITKDEISSGIFAMGFLGLIQKIEASSELSFPEGMVADIVAMVEKDTNRGTQLLGNWSNQLSMFEQMGHIQREKDMLKSKFEFKQGMALINGKPMNQQAAQSPY